jgi:hypothetical protein
MSLAMDRLLASLLLLDLVAWLLWELVGWGLDGARGRTEDGEPRSPRLAPTRPAAVLYPAPPRASPPPGAEAEPALADCDRRFLARVGRERRLTAAEKGKLVELARHAAPELQWEAVSILVDDPDQHPFIWRWLEEQDRRLLELVRRLMETGEITLSPELVAMLEGLSASPDASPSTFPSQAPVALPPADSTPVGPSEVIPEYAGAHELFLALQHFQDLPADIRTEQATALIQNGLLASDPYVRGAAVAAMGRCSIQDASLHLRRLLGDESSYVRGCAVDALCELEKAGALSALEQVLQDEDTLEVLEIVLVNLSQMNVPEALQTLDRHLDHLPEPILPMARRVRQSLARKVAPSRPCSSRPEAEPDGQGQPGRQVQEQRPFEGFSGEGGGAMREDAGQAQQHEGAGPSPGRNGQRGGRSDAEPGEEPPR